METHVCHKFKQASKMLSKPWVGLIINQLLHGPKRFNQLESEIHISGKVLSTKLRELEHLGLINRLIYDEKPVRIEYQLTEKGKSLEPIMKTIADWSQTWIT